jgi:colanic acid biosynthesis glycosyl transferase WcaI
LGTIGMAHGLDTIIEAAQLTKDPRVQFLIIGEGAHRRALAAKLAELNLANITLLPKQSRNTVRSFLELSDVSMVLLKNLPLFETVIPSKLLEAMGCGKPVILGVRGESKEILELAKGGIAIPPEDAQALVSAVEQFLADPELRNAMGTAGKAYTLAHFNRKSLAEAFWLALQGI